MFILLQEVMVFIVFFFFNIMLYIVVGDVFVIVLQNYFFLYCRVLSFGWSFIVSFRVEVYDFI